MKGHCDIFITLPSGTLNNFTLINQNQLKDVSAIVLYVCLVFCVMKILALSEHIMLFYKNNLKINILSLQMHTSNTLRWYFTVTSEWIITEMSWLTVFLIAKTKSLSVPGIQGGGHSRGRHRNKQQIEQHDNAREK